MKSPEQIDKEAEKLKKQLSEQEERLYLLRKEKENLQKLKIKDKIKRIKNKIAEETKVFMTEQEKAEKEALKNQDVIVRNNNFICNQMGRKDVEHAFDFIGSTGDYIYDVLIERGYLKKYPGYYKPTKKLITLAFGAKEIILESHQLRFLAVNNLFYRGELDQLFGNKHISQQAIETGWFLLQRGKYRKSVKLEEWLTEGENKLILEKGGNTNE